MSWSAPIKACRRQDLSKVLEELEVAGGPPSPAQEESVAAAKQALLLLAGSGAVGDEMVWVAGYLSGHTNPEHKPTGGWSNDSISIQLAQVEEPRPEGASNGAN